MSKPSGMELPFSRRGMFGRHGLELCLVGLFAITLAVITLQHRIFGRDVVVSDATASAFLYSGYADDVEGGSSTFIGSSRPLSWICHLKPGAESLFCGNDVVFDRNGRTRGIDMRTLESLKLTLDYQGPSDTLRLQLKNGDPRYSRAGDRVSAKPNKVEFSVRQGRHVYTFAPQDLSVADWWLTGKDLAPELARTQLDDIVSVDISTGSEPSIGQHRIDVESITFRRSLIAPAQLYLGIMGIWALLIAGYMSLRVRLARRDAIEKERAQEQEQAALAHAASAAERANQAKTDFLANVSHELRTPLNAIVGYAQILQGRRLADEDRRAVLTIHRSGDHVLSLISDLLDLSKVEAGKMEIHCNVFDLRGVIGTTAEMIELRSTEKGISFTCELAEDLPVSVFADEKKLRQILLNLLSNAVKFTKSGTVALCVKKLNGSADRTTLRFEVVDTGAGVSESDLDRLFRPFEQVGDGYKQDGGTGLGLSITQKLAGLMGAVIQVESHLGQGSRFWFDVSFPLAAPETDVARSPTAASVTSTIRGEALRPSRLLAAEDNPTNQHILRAMLEPAGFELDVVENGQDAFDAIRSGPYDLVLMDAQMPIMTGVEATRVIRDWEASVGRQRTPILALSGDVMPYHLAQYQAVGMDGHVEKPIRLEQLFEAIRIAIDANAIDLTEAA